jgi:hypothetical protein
MVTTLESGHRKARKPHFCGLCGRRINPGDLHAYQNNVYDGRAYTWRDCIWCDRDSIVHYVSDWMGGWTDEGVGGEQAVEWARQAAEWPKHWLAYIRPITATERNAARAWLARAAGGEGE